MISSFSKLFSLSFLILLTTFSTASSETYQCHRYNDGSKACCRQEECIFTESESHVTENDDPDCSGKILFIPSDGSRAYCRDINFCFLDNIRQGKFSLHIFLKNPQKECFYIKIEYSYLLPDGRNVDVQITEMIEILEM